MVYGQLTKISFFIILIACFARGAHTTPGHQRTGDYLIIEKPAALKIYNKYEQKTDPAETAWFRPFCALRLIDINMTLSDNFTLADRIELAGKFFYLLKVDRQALDISQSPGYLKEFRRVLVIEDTVVISRNDMIYLYSPAAPAEKTFLPGGTLLHRIFLNGNLTYVQTLAETRQYGWCNFSNKTGWHKLDQAATAANLGDIMIRIQPVLDRYNSHYHNFFQYFNDQTGEQRAIPCWQVELKNKRITGRLLNISGSVIFQNSLPYLINELQQQLRGTQLQIKQTAAGIVIE